MEDNGLLKSDSYGVKTSGKQKLWRIFTAPTKGNQKRQQDKIVEEFALSVTKWKIHGSLYDHEKTAAEIFVSLVLTGRLEKWEGEGDQKFGVRYDRMFKILDDPRIVYLEVEMGNHGKPILSAKILAYQKLYRETKQKFCVLFAMLTEKEVRNMIKLFAELNAPNHYWSVVTAELIDNPLEARISNINETFTLIS